MPMVEHVGNVLNPHLARILDLALAEDIGSGDLTARATVPADTGASGDLLAKQEGVVSGLEVARAAFYRVDESIDFVPVVRDGDTIENGTVIAVVHGRARSLLAAERVALNFLQRLSGVATMTAAFVEPTLGTKARVVDTRKTTPGMRKLEREAVLHGGGHNHRFGLSDGVLIKDNHLAAIGGPDRVTQAVQSARDLVPHTIRVEIEVTTIAEAAEAVEAGADIIMLDNMSLNDMAEAVALINGRSLVEASGGVNLGTIGKIARTGVDIISVGALTHSAPSLDISLDFHIIGDQ